MISELGRFSPHQTLDLGVSGLEEDGQHQGMVFSVAKLKPGQLCRGEAGGSVWPVAAEFAGLGPNIIKIFGTHCGW